MPEYDDYADIIDELDAHADLPRKSADFIADLIERKPNYLSLPQIEWIEDLQRRYLA